MSFRRVLLCLAVLGTLAPSTTLAQETRAPPRHRIDVDVFTPGAFVATNGLFVDGFLSGQVGLRAAFPSGDGVFFDASLSMALLSVTYPLAETGYLRRFWLSGNDIEGLALEVQVGASAGYRPDAYHSQSGVRIPASAVGGPDAAVSLDYRDHHLVLGVMIRYRALYDGSAVDHVASAIFRVTFGFWE